MRLVGLVLAALVACLVSTKASAQISFIDVNFNNSTESGLVLVRPLQTAPGDLMLVIIASRGSGVINTAGWSVAVAPTIDGSNVTVTALYRFATASDSTTYTFSTGLATRMSGALVIYRGVHASNPIAAAGGNVAGATAQIIANSLSVPDAPTLLVGAFGQATGTSAITPQPTMSPVASVRAGVTPGASMTVASESLSGFGDSGQRTAVSTATARSVTALIALRPAAVSPPSFVGRFNAFESTTAASAVTGFIRTKVVGQPFAVDIASINNAGSSYAAVAMSGIRVDLLDSSNNAGVVDSSGCRSSWSPVATLTSSFSMAAADAGRKSFTSTANVALRQARLRITWTGSGGSVSGCSTDDFAIRPAAFVDAAATDATATSAGTARALANVGAVDGVVHRAGRPFTLSARAVDANGGTTSGYDGAPQTIASCVQPTGCTAGSLTGSLAATAGAVTGTLIYEEAGVISISLIDSTFAQIDANDAGSTLAERTIVLATPATVGRFIADSYTVQVMPPSFKAGCVIANLTFAGQPFSFTVPPLSTVVPLSASGKTLSNARPRFDASMVLVEVTSLGAPLALQGSIGGLVLTHSSVTQVSVGTGTFKFERGSQPVPPFTPSFAMRIVVTDTTEPNDGSPVAIVGQGSTSFGFPGQHTVHYGVLSLRPSYGDARQDLLVPLDLLSYNGLGWVPQPAAAACLSIGINHFSYFAARGSLATNGAFNCASSAVEVAPRGARWLVKLRRPAMTVGPTEGSLDLQLNTLPIASGQVCSAGTPAAATGTLNAPWLARPDGTNPVARIQWGRSRGDFIYMREMF